MTKAPKPGPDERARPASAAGDLWHSLGRLRAGRVAQARVTFGELGTLFAQALWPECWHHSYPNRPVLAGHPPGGPTGRTALPVR